MSRYESTTPFDSKIIGPQLLKVAEEKAMLLHSKYAPSMKPFMDKDVYGEAAVTADLLEVLRLEKEFKKAPPAVLETKRISNIFEVYFVDAANSMQWLGGNTNIEQSARFDDYKNKVDAIATFKDAQSRYGHLALSADLTFGIDASMTKIEEILSDISSGRMSHIRYFHSPEMGYTGRLGNLPKCIIGLDSEHLSMFIRLWTHDPSNPALIDIRNILIHQLYHQLRALTAYADKRHGTSIIRDSYTRAARQVGAVYNNLQLSDVRIPRDKITEQVINL
jgi:hypothetical protein